MMLNIYFYLSFLCIIAPCVTSLFLLENDFLRKSSLLCEYMTGVSKIFVKGQIMNILGLQVKRQDWEY